MASIKDVAKRANVSTATVSRVLNGSGVVQEAKREAVQEAIKELGYYPNAVARSLKSDTTHTVGILVSDISNMFFTVLAKAVEDSISSFGYNIIMCSTENSKSREKAYLDMLVSKKVDGILINTTGENDTYIAEISKQIPFVAIERSINHNLYQGDYVANDNKIAIRMLTELLINNGHRKIGVINGPQHLSSAYERYEAFCSEMSKIVKINKNKYKYRYDGDFSVNSGFDGAKYLYHLEERPTAVIVMNNMMMVGALKYFKTEGILIPEQMSIVNYGDLQNPEILYVKPTFSSLSPELIGVKAAELLLERIKNRGGCRKEILMVSQMVQGETVKRL